MTKPKYKIILEKLADIMSRFLKNYPLTKDFIKNDQLLAEGLKNIGHFSNNLYIMVQEKQHADPKNKFSELVLELMTLINKMHDYLQKMKQISLLYASEQVVEMLLS